MDPVDFTSPRSKDYVDWSDAYVRVESYLYSLSIQNKLLMSQLVAKILARAAKRLKEEPLAEPQMLAMREARNEIHDWLRSVMEAAQVEVDDVSVRGRLALFLADMPRRWQGEFLHPGPWPEDFLAAFRSSFLKTSPDFEKGVMRPREIDLGPVSALADETWRVIDRWPLLGTLLVWGIYLGALGLIFYLTR